jgi:hypothetical protein
VFLSDVAAQLTTDDGWDMSVCNRMWLIVSVDTFEEKPEGIPVYLGRAQGNYCWFVEFEDDVFIFDHLADAKADIARADSVTTVPLFLINLGDLLRYCDTDCSVEGLDVIEQTASRSFIRYLNNRQAWVSNKWSKG